jgi:hypothetical protein
MNSKSYKPHKQLVHDQPAPAQTENEDADPVGKIPGAKELEEAAKRVKRPAKAGSARAADSVQQEAEITEAAMPTPAGVKHPNF